MSELDIEYKTFCKKLRRLLQTDAGRYVLIKGTKVIEIFDSESDAVDHGYNTLGNVSFLVQKIEIRKPIQLTTLFPLEN